MADAADGRTVTFPPLGETHRDKVKATLGPLVAVANPLDYHTFIWNDEPAMTATFTAMIAGGFDLNMLVLDFPRADRCSDADWWPTVRASRRAEGERCARRNRRLDGGELPEGHARGTSRARHRTDAGIEEAMAAAEAAAFVGTVWARPPPSGRRP